MKAGFVSSGLLVVALACSTALFAQDQGTGESVYKSKCSGCHGPNAEGKIGPNLKKTTLSEDDILLMLGKGKEGKKAPHSKPLSGLNDDQIKAVAHYVKSLK